MVQNLLPQRAPPATASVTKTNETEASVDGSSAVRSVSFTTADFAAGAQVEKVQVSLTFSKVGGLGPCPNHDDEQDTNNYEIFYWLTSPVGTKVVLIEDWSNQGGSSLEETYYITLTEGLRAQSP